MSSNVPQTLWSLPRRFRFHIHPLLLPTVHHPSIYNPPAIYSSTQTQNNNNTKLQTNRACGRLSHARNPTYHQSSHQANKNPIIHPPTHTPIHPPIHPSTYPYTHPITKQ